MRDLIDLANTLLTLHVMSDGAPVRKMHRVEMWDLSIFFCDMRRVQRSGAPLAVEVVRKVFILSQFHIGP